MRSWLRRAAAAFLLASSLAPLHAAPPSTWPPPLADPISPLSWPESSARVREVLGRAVEQGDRALAAEAARLLAAMGAGLSEPSQARIAPALDPALAAGLRAQFAANVVPVMASRLETQVPVEHHLIEGIAWDAASGRLFVGSIADRRLLVREGEAWRVVPLPADVAGVFALAVDPQRRQLWLASGVADPVPGRETAFRGLIALDLATLAVVRRLTVPDGASPGDLALAPDGSVYASDGAGGGVYAAAPGAREMIPIPWATRLSSTQGLALSRDGSRLYIASYGHGLAVLDLSGRRHLYRLQGTMPVMLDGVDGLVADGDDLIAIQNGTSPRRIVRIRLSPGGLAIAGVEVLERRHPDWGEPTLGTIAGDRLLYVADGQWERYAPGGAPLADVPARPTAIRALPLRGPAIP
ncbi:MAG: SMP-30/gluconolactonase/LRE family protein [Allosphingosinicella sp.]